MDLAFWQVASARFALAIIWYGREPGWQDELAKWLIVLPLPKWCQDLLPTHTLEVDQLVAIGTFCETSNASK
jgi:hypothetical protein